MKQMKRLFFICLMSVLSLGAFAQTDRGDSSVGLNVGYGFDSENVTLGLDYRYNFTDHIRIAPSLSYFIKKDHTSAWAIDLNAQYVFKLTEMFGFYPLAGLDLAFWKHKVGYGDWDWDDHDYDHDGDASIDRTRFGVNLGLGAELYATEAFTLGLEVKYNIVKDYDQVLIGLRLGYNF